MKKILLVLTLCFTLTSCASAGKKSDSNVVQVQTETDTIQETTGQQEDIVLTFAMSGDITPEVQEVIDRFNETDNGYQVVIKSYSEGLVDENMGYTDEILNQIDFRLVQDIINTDNVDIVSSWSFGNNAKMEILENKGAFIDLYKFMENDSTVNKSTLNEHILTLSEKDGKLYHLPINYSVTTLIGETRYVGEKENWTFDEFMERWNNMPDNATINNARDSTNAYTTVLRANLESFIDYENAEVHFDSPEFREMLEFCGTFPSTYGQKSEYYYDAPLFAITRIISGFRCADTYFDDDHTYTMVGFPSDNGEGAYISTFNFALCSSSSTEKQQGAWEFIKLFAEEEYQSDNYVQVYGDGTYTDYSEEFSYPMNNNVFNQKMQDVMNGMYQPVMYEHETGELIVNTPSQTECNRLVEYLNSIDRLETAIDRNLWLIINEEIMLYFNNEKTLDECIDMIQNRTSLWISEQA